MAHHGQPHPKEIDNVSPKHRPISKIPSIWNTYLYQLQQQAPMPRRIYCNKNISVQPSHYGREFHGKISREEADYLLLGPDGGYLVRESSRAPGHYTLSMRFGGITKNFKLYYDGQHYVGEKRFDTVQELVYDGLIMLYLEAHARDYIATMCASSKYEDGPYMTLKRHVRAQTKQKRLSTQSIIEDPVINVKQYEKPHQFKVHTFRGLAWCDFCGNFMWGIIAQGVQCEDCGLSTHRRCSENLPNDCCPDLKHIRRVFGIDLTTLVKAHNVVRPPIVDICIAEIEKRGIGTEGLYRMSGFSDDVEALRVAFDKDMENVPIHLYDDVHVITGVLKLYFRLLPIPVITPEIYPKLMSASKQPTIPDKLECMRLALGHLAPAHYQTLKHLLAHLYRVSQQHQTNLMTPHNLSTVFCPTLLRSPDQLLSWQHESALIELLITHYSILFEK